MMHDPIVQEIHQVRAKLLEECGGDLDKLADRLRAAAQERPKGASPKSKKETHRRRKKS